MSIRTLGSGEATLLTHPYKFETDGWLPKTNGLQFTIDQGSDSRLGLVCLADQKSHGEFTIFNQSASQTLFVIMCQSTNLAPAWLDFAGFAPCFAILPRQSEHVVLAPGMSAAIDTAGTATAVVTVRYTENLTQVTLG